MLHYKKDGTLDMRYKTSKEFMAKQAAKQASQAAKSNIFEEKPSNSWFSNLLTQTLTNNMPSFETSKPSQSYTTEKTKKDSDFYIINGKVKRDCAAVKNGDVKFTASGAIDKRSKAVRSGKLKILENGAIDSCSELKEIFY